MRNDAQRYKAYNVTEIRRIPRRSIYTDSLDLTLDSHGHQLNGVPRPASTTGDNRPANASLLIMAALWNRAGHYIFALWFFFFFLLLFLA